MATFRLLLVATLLALPFWVGLAMRAEGCVRPATPPSLDQIIASVDVIVVGTVGEILVLPPDSVPDSQDLFGYTPVEYKVAVDEYLKGSGPMTVLVFQLAQNIAQDSERISSVDSPHTDCGYTTITLGDHEVFLLRRADELRYRAQVRKFADEREVESYIADIRAAVARQTGLPPTGSGPSHSGPPIVPLAAASALAGVALLANAAFAVRRRSK